MIYSYVFDNNIISNFLAQVFSMNSNISLVVRFLYSIVAVFFFVFTVQPTIAAGTYDKEIEILKGVVDDGTNIGEIDNPLEKLPDGNPVLISRILSLKDADGNNLAHKAVYSGRLELLPKLFKVCGVAIFEAKNTAGLNSFEANPWGLGHIFRAIDFSNYYGNDINKVIEVQNKLKPLALASVTKLVAQYRQYKSDLAVEVAKVKVLQNSLNECDYHSSPKQCAALREQLEKIQKEGVLPIERELENSVVNLGSFVGAFGIQVLRGIIPLEQIDDYNFYRTLSYSEKCKEELRAYRTGDRKTLYDYFNENAKSDQGRLCISELLQLYYGAGILVPTAAEVDITTIDSDWKFKNFLQTPDGKNFFEKYRNSQGQNLAFIAANDTHLLQRMKDQGVDVERMLNAKDIHGNDGISQIRDYWGYDGVVSDTVFELIKEKVTNRREKEEEERERIWRQEQEEQDRLHEEAFTRGIKTVNAKLFNDDWWHEVISTFNLEGNSQGFASSSLGAILRQNSSPLRDSFLQQSPMDFAGQANQLWSSFFTTYDELVRQEEQTHYSGYSRFDEKMPARPVRVLNIFARFGQNSMMGQEPNPLVVETMQTLWSNILATGGTFGMDFKRAATEAEVEIMIESLRDFGRSFVDYKRHNLFETLEQAIKSIGEENFEEISDLIAAHNPAFTGKVTDKDNMHASILEYVVEPAILKMSGEAANEIMQRLFRTDSKFSNEEKWKLEDHQTNCAVIALASIFQKHNRGGSSEIDFAEINRILASRPLMRDTSARYYRSSEQRYEDLMDMTGRHYGVGGMHMPHSEGGYRSGDERDFGEEY